MQWAEFRALVKYVMHFVVPCCNWYKYSGYFLQCMYHVVCMLTKTQYFCTHAVFRHVMLSKQTAFIKVAQCFTDNSLNRRCVFTVR